MELIKYKVQSISNNLSYNIGCISYYKIFIWWLCIQAGRSLNSTTSRTRKIHKNQQSSICIHSLNEIMCVRCEIDVVVNWHVRELTGFLVSLLSLLRKKNQAPGMSIMSVCLLYVPFFE